MKKIINMKIVGLILYILLFSSVLKAQNTDCGNSINALVLEKKIPDGEQEICSAKNGEIRFIANIQDGEIVSMRSIDKNGISLNPTKKTTSTAKEKSKGKSTSSSPKQTLMKTVCEIWTYTMANGSKYTTTVCTLVPK
jgi:hypothetical protein